MEKVIRTIINDTALESLRINELAKSKAQSIIANALRQARPQGVKQSEQ